MRDAQVAVWTNQGNRALLRVLAGDTLHVTSLAVYSGTGQLLLSGQDLQIRGSYTFDVDTGAEMSGDADLWWNSVSPGVNNLEPQNGARLALCPDMPPVLTPLPPAPPGLTPVPPAASGPPPGQPAPPPASRPAEPTTIKGKTRAEWQEIWRFNADTSEDAARQGKCHQNLGIDLTRCVPEYCETDEHCQIGHTWWGGWDQETLAYCIANECRDNEHGLTLNPNRSPCTSTSECDNKNFWGDCVQDTCRSFPRKDCLAPGTYEACVTLDGPQGRAMCRGHKKLGTCLPFG